jgi:uncharacterized protein YjiS (DUF1127 family)
MAYSLLFSERPSSAAASANPLQAIRAWLAARRVKRAQRLALMHLLEFDAALLDDLGIDRQDVLCALRGSPESAGRVLSARRASASTAWLSRPTALAVPVRTPSGLRHG